MKRQILIGLASLAMVSVALGRTDPSFLNDLVLIAPPASMPVIDATNFINTSAFIDNTFNSLFVTPYTTANTLYYTNFGVLGALEGFRFDTYNTHTGSYANAGTLYNGVGAVINCGGTNDGHYFTTNNLDFFLTAVSFGGALCKASATNIINQGTINMGPDSLLSLQGQNISLSGGLLNMEGFETGGFFLTAGMFNTLSFFGTAGMFDGYWGLGQTPYNYNPLAYFTSMSPSSPTHWVTNRDYLAMEQFLSLPQANAYLNPFAVVGPSNFLYQIVFLQNTDPSISNNVYFAGPALVEWVWPATNYVTGTVQTNHLYLEDYMIGITNLMLTTNGIGPASTGFSDTFIPTNYFFFQSGALDFGTPVTPGLPPGVIGPNTNWTTEFTAYEAIFLPTTVIPGEVAGQTYTNMPGRIEVTASKQLDLSSSRIAGLNYLRLTAPNNFTQDRDTRIMTAVADYDLGVTNATLTFSNLLAPTCPRLNGYVDVFSTTWTNIDSANITNTYFITMVDSHLASWSPCLLQNLTLHATNTPLAAVVISDVLTVLSNITIDTYNLIITTNGPGSQTPAGQLVMPSGLPLGASALPRLRTLTNSGTISVQNLATFGSSSQPLWDFVNHGSVLAQGCSVSATNFVNTGLIDSGAGPINVAAASAVLSNGVFNAPFNDIVLGGGSLFITNQILNAGHSLVIFATNSLSDGGPASGNVWTAGVLGFNLTFEPPVASLLGTTITDTAPAYASVACQWAGRDLGPVAAGYSNNAALGRLILDGGTPASSFVFNAPATNNALYVDYLEFRNNLTNFDSSGSLANLYFGPGMKIYYAQLIINGVSWAEKLNHQNGGGLNWVSAYAGAFSSTNLIYPDGTTNLLNLALVQSCDLDSNGNGIANCQDPAPVFVQSEVGLAAALTNAPPHEIVLSWNSIPYSTNSVLFKPSLTATNWQLLTNFVLGSAGGRQRIVDPVTAGGRFYRVRVEGASP
jgi:hypothetical protein